MQDSELAVVAIMALLTVILIAIPVVTSLGRHVRLVVRGADRQNRDVSK